MNIQIYFLIWTDLITGYSANNNLIMIYFAFFTLFFLSLANHLKYIFHSIFEDHQLVALFKLILFLFYLYFYLIPIYINLVELLDDYIFIILIQIRH